MADEILLNQEEFLTYEGLETFKGLQDAFNDEKIATAKQAANDYADSLAENYDAAGTAQTKMEELRDGAVKANTEAIESLTTQVATDIEEAVKAETDARIESVQAVQDEVDALEQTHADDKAELEGKIQANADAIQAHKDLVDAKVATLIGTDTDKSVRTIANEELAAQLLSGKADADFKTLQELAAWLEDHPEDVAEINLNITNLQTLVGELPEDATATDVVGYVAELVAAEKARAEEVEGGLADRIADLEEAVGEGGSVDSQIDAKIGALDADVTSAEVEDGKGLRVQVTETDGKVDGVVVTGNFDNSYDTKGAAATAKTEAIDAAAQDATTKANQAEANAKAEVTTLANGAVKDNTDAIANIKANMPTPIPNEKIQAMFTKSE